MGLLQGKHTHTHLGDPVLPAHPPETRRRQDDGGEVLLLVQLLQTRVEVPALRNERSGEQVRRRSELGSTHREEAL